MTQLESALTEVYQGQFGEYRITEGDRTGVKIYRASLGVAALCLAIATALILSQGNTPVVLNTITVLFGVFSLALGVSLFTIHIYLASLHRALQVLWGMGTLAAFWFMFQSPEPLALTIYNQPYALIGVGFTFAALTGIYFKEAFCFNRLETKILTPLVPLLLLGRLMGVLSIEAEKILLALWAGLFIVFVLRKFIQPFTSDIGDKSVFVYLENQKQARQVKG